MAPVAQINQVLALAQQIQLARLEAVALVVDARHLLSRQAQEAGPRAQLDDVLDHLRRLEVIGRLQTVMLGRLRSSATSSSAICV